MNKRCNPTIWVLAAAIGTIAGAGCEKTGLREGTGTGTGGLETQYTYTPEGCDYEVSTPEVVEAGPSVESGPDGGDGSTLDHVHVSFAGPADTTLAVNWRSEVDNRTSEVLLGTSKEAVENADGPADGVAVYSGHHLLFEDLLGDQTRVHEVHVCGLEPNTVYYYKVGGKGAWSGIFETATAPELGTKDPISITLFGDSRNATEDLWPMTVKKISEGNPDLMLFSGDAVFLGTQQSLWNNFFEASTGDFRVQDLFSRVPFMSANGNHDALAVNYVAQFAFPQDPSPNEAAQGEEWYSFDYGNTHVAVLNDTVNDASVIGGSQASWLRADLGAVDRDKTPWVFVMHHRPFYTCLSTHRPDNALRDAWQDIFDEFKVDMVFTGHNHVYERSLPIRGLTDGQGQAAAAGPNGVPEVDGEGSPSGTIYIVSAGAGAETYAVSDECALSYTAASAHHYSTVEIEDRKITFTARNTMSDAVIDTFTYEK